MSIESQDIELNQLFKSIFLFILKKKWLLLFAFLFGSLLGYYKTIKDSKKYTSYYESKFFVESPFLEDDEIYSAINNSSLFLHQNKANAASEILDNNDFTIECVRELFFDDKKPAPKVIITSKDTIAKSMLIKIVNSIFESNQTLKENLLIEKKTVDEFSHILNNPFSNADSLYVSDKEDLLNLKIELEKKIKSIENPIQLLPVNPLNDLIKPRSKTLTILGTGLVISALIGFLLFLFHLLKNKN